MKRLAFVFLAALILTLVSPFSLAAQSRHPPSGGGGGGHVAAPRGGSSGGGHVSSPPPSSGAVQRGSSGGGPAPQGQARPRGAGGPGYGYGQAVPRSQYYGNHLVPPARYYGVSPWYYYSPYVYGAWGIGYWGWNPYWWGYPYYSPWGGYWGYPYYGGYYGGGYGGGYDYSDHEDHGYGSLRLKIKQKEAEVYSDGYYMGLVDDFDGSWSHLDLEAGPHHIEVRANGYRPLTFDINITPGKTVTYSGDLKPGGE